MVLGILPYKAPLLSPTYMHHHCWHDFYPTRKYSISVIIMNPKISCRVEADCHVYPSEDEEKIRTVFAEIFPESNTKIEGNTASVFFENIECLEKIRTVIESRKSQNAYRKRLRRNMDENRSWFLLNKQAAYVGKVALCDEEDDSPLGTIRIMIESSDLEDLIDWFVPFV